METKIDAAATFFSIDSRAAFVFSFRQRRFELPACGRLTNAAKAATSLVPAKAATGFLFWVWSGPRNRTRGI
jgi:hypothetical protein